MELAKRPGGFTRGLGVELGLLSLDIPVEDHVAGGRWGYGGPIFTLDGIGGLEAPGLEALEHRQLQADIGLGFLSAETVEKGARGGLEGVVGVGVALGQAPQG